MLIRCHRAEFYLQPDTLTICMPKFLPCRSILKTATEVFCPFEAAIAIHAANGSLSPLRGDNGWSDRVCQLVVDIQLSKLERLQARLAVSDRLPIDLGDR